MGSLMIRCGAAVVALAVLWLFTAHWLSLLVDQVSMAPLASAPATPFGWDGVTLQFGEPFAGGPKGDSVKPGTSASMLDLEGPGPGYPEVAKARVDADNRLMLSVNGRDFVLGSRAGTTATGGTPATTIPTYAAEPGDVSTLTIQRSWLSWPVFGLNPHDRAVRRPGGGMSIIASPGKSPRASGSTCCGASNKASIPAVAGARRAGPRTA